MKVIIFAGGIGTRLWPLSRKNTPKQFEKIIGDKSTIQQAVDRLLPEFSFSDIYIATGKRYQDIVREQLPQIPSKNFVFEPQMRDVGPAIGLMASILAKEFPNEPMAILWSDHMVKQIEIFKKALFIAEKAISQKQSDFVFIAQKPRFANQNMGWIEVGEELEQTDNVTVFRFKKLFYRPKLQEAVSFFENKNFVWNLGYFVTTPIFLQNMYKQFAPSLFSSLQEIASSYGGSDFEQKLQDIYPKLEKVSFDDLVLVKMEANNTLVISADLGWSDVGAWESLKEALSKTQQENATKGKVLIQDSRDSLVFNYNDQLLVGIDLEEMLIINTADVILVCPKKSVPKIKKLVESLSGTPHEHLT